MFKQINFVIAATLLLSIQLLHSSYFDVHFLPIRDVFVLIPQQVLSTLLKRCKGTADGALYFDYPLQRRVRTPSLLFKPIGFVEGNYVIDYFNNIPPVNQIFRRWTKIKIAH